MRLIVGISGSSGSIYAKVMLDQLIEYRKAEFAVVISDNGKKNWELEYPHKKLEEYTSRIYENRDFAAPFASGSSAWDAMIICPCSAGMLGRIANGTSDDLMTRAADVMLKERRKLILVLRETPLHLIHIENMQKITLAGGIVCPAIPSFYSKPESMEALAATVTSRALALANLHVPSFKWGEIN